jgi:hypothetical protein
MAETGQSYFPGIPRCGAGLSEGATMPLVRVG